MSIDITITHTDKGFFRKALPFDVLCAQGLSFGSFDGLRLDVGEVGAEDFILFHPDHIGRGFSVTWRKGEKNQVSLRLLTPSTAEETDDFYDTVERVVGFWKQSTIEQDGLPITVDQLPEWRTSMKDFSLSTLADFLSRDKDSFLTLFCAMWPLTLGAEERALLADATDLSGFRDYLHEKQSVDAYYAKPRFYSHDDEVMGSYTLTEDVRSIFPNAPSVPLWMEQEDGQDFEVQSWVVTFYSVSQDRILGVVSYADFLSEIPGWTYYDGANSLIEGVSLPVLEAVVAKCGIEI
ncbi:MAG: DUF4299 domain-containing protein [Propionibacteriaceae bacterium]|jgi:hypothetical protein|nr:DUF4299 domain-containing protein [Propionibacteriaceae bacterium]